MTECCPPTAHPYLATDYAAKGTTLTIDGGVEVYEAPPPAQPTASLLLLPDVWGWAGGRIRAIADGLASEGYYVVVGKMLSTPALDGGTDGDALPPGGTFSLEWIKNFPCVASEAKRTAVRACAA